MIVRRSSDGKRPFRLSSRDADVEITRRDFHDIGSGRPDFVEWCFYAPWEEPARKISFDSSAKVTDVFSTDYLREDDDDDDDSHAPKWNRYWKRKFDPRHSSIIGALTSRDFRRYEGSPFCNKSVIGAISSLTATFCSYGGFLPINDVLTFAENWSSNVSSSDLLHLLRHVPYSELSRTEDESLIDVLQLVLTRLRDENVSVSRRYIEKRRSSVFPAKSRLGDRFDSSSDESRWDDTSTFFDEGTGRIWLFVEPSEYYVSLARNMVSFQQLNAHTYRKRSLEATSIERANGPLLTYREEGLSHRINEEETRTVRREVEIREMFSKTLLILAIVRLSNDFFTPSFLTMLRDEEVFLSTERKTIDIMEDLFLTAMDYGNVVAALPYSLFAPRETVRKRCVEFERNVDCLGHSVARSVVRYMLHVRGYERFSQPRDDFATNETYERSIARSFDNFFEETFFPTLTSTVDEASVPSTSTVSTLMLRSLATILRHQGLTYALNNLTRYVIPNEFLSLTHNYFAFTTWNFLRRGMGTW